MPEQAWKDSLEKRKQMLSPDEFQTVAAILDYNTFQTSIKALRVKYEQKKFTACMRKLDGACDHLRQFTEAVSVMVQSDPTAAALIWGGILLILKIVGGHARGLEKITDLFVQLSHAMPRFDRYCSLFPQNMVLASHLMEIYDVYITFLIEAIKYLKRNPVGNLLFFWKWSPINKSHDEAKKQIVAHWSDLEGEVRVTVDEETVGGVRELQRALPYVHISTAVKSFSTVVLPHNDYFSGRDEMLQELHTFIQPQVSTPSQRSCVLHGLGGSGKTQVALEYTYRYRNSYKWIFWLRAENDPGLAESYSAIASTAGLSNAFGTADQKQNIDIAWKWLSATDDTWLLVFDNVDDKNVLTRYIPASAHGSVIFTTQDIDVSTISLFRIHVQGFPGPRGAKLLLKYLVSDNHDVDLAEEISELVGGLPLAIAHIGGYINSSGVSLREFVLDFKDRQGTSEIWQRDPTSTSFYERSLQTVFDIALGNLTRDARNLIDCFAFLNPDSIPVEMIFSEHQHASLQYLSDSPKNKKRIRELKENLRGRHLVETNTITPGNVKFTIHRSLQRDLLLKLDREPEERQRVFDQAFEMIRRVLPRQSPIQEPTNHDWPVYEQYLPHVLSLHSIFRHAETPFESTLGFAELLSDLGNYMWERNLANDAFFILETAEKVCEEVSNTSTQDPVEVGIIRQGIIDHKATFELNHGISLRSDGLKHKIEVLDFRENLKMIHQERFGPGHVDVDEEIRLANAYNNVGCGWMHLDDYEKAEPYLSSALEIKRQYLTEENSAFAFAESYKNLSLVHMSRGATDQAFEYMRKAVELNERLNGNDTKTVQFFKYLQALLYFHCGELQIALDRNLEILKVRERILTAIHDHTLDSRYMVGNIFFELKQYENARLHLEECLKMQHEWFESRTARAMFKLSQVLDKLDESEESSKNLTGARKIFDKMGKRRSAGTHGDENELFDQMVSLWAGRCTGPLSQRKPPGVPTHM